MNIYLLGLGSNISPRQHLEQAEHKLCRLGTLLATSPVLITKPVGETFSDDFGNQLIVVASQLPATMLKHQLLLIETELGREPKSPGRKTRDRTIDIDILQQSIASNATDAIVLQQPINPSYNKSSDIEWAHQTWQIEDSYYLDVLHHWRQKLAA